MGIDTGVWKRSNHWAWMNPDGVSLNIKHSMMDRYYLLIIVPRGTSYGWATRMKLLVNPVKADGRYSYSDNFPDIEYMAEKLMRSGELDRLLEKYPYEPFTWNSGRAHEREGVLRRMDAAIKRRVDARLKHDAMFPPCEQ